jgi:O-antigen ligase
LNIFSEKNRSQFVEWIGVVSCFYYPITAVIIYKLQLPSTPINIGIKLCLAVGCMLSVLLAIFGSKPRIHVGILWVMVFWFIYSIRLIYDVSIRNIPMDSRTPFMIYSMTYGATLLPILAIATNNAYLSFISFSKKSWQLIFIANISMLYYVISSPEAIHDLFLTRLDLKTNDESSVLNPITISLFGELLALLSLNKLINSKERLFNKFVYLLSLLIGITHLLLGASRGPFISFFLCLSIIFYINFVITKKGIVYYLKLIATLFIIFFALFYAYQTFSVDSEVAIASRVTSFLKDGSGGDLTTDEDPRVSIYLGAWNDFLDSPIIGKQYVSTNYNFYPHNLILEVLMSTGILGFFFFFPFLFLSLLNIKKIIKHPDKDSLTFLLILFPTILSGMTSGAIFHSPELWIILVFILSSNK